MAKSGEQTLISLYQNRKNGRHSFSKLSRTYTTQGFATFTETLDTFSIIGMAELNEWGKLSNNVWRFCPPKGYPVPFTDICLPKKLYYIGIYWVSNKSGFKSKSDLIYKFPKIGKMQKLFLSTIVKDNKGLLLRNSFLDYL